MRDYEAEERINAALREKRAARRRKRRRRARIKRALVLAAMFLILVGIITGIVFLARAVVKMTKSAGGGTEVTEEYDGTDAEDEEPDGEEAGDGLTEEEPDGEEAGDGLTEEEPDGEESGDDGGDVQEDAAGGNALESGAAYSAALSTLEDSEIFAASEEGEDEGDSSSSSGVYVVSGRDEASYLGSDEVVSTNALVVDVDTMTAVAQKDASATIYPASMTKVLTLLVAVENITDFDDTFEMTIEITDYSYSNDCSAVGFSVGEVVTIWDLLYGTILPSGADAAAGLAYYVSGSLEDFVVLMNEKLEELGISDTAHFTNCVGLYDDDHYCTLYDMAIIMEAAIDNEICREVLSAHTYTTTATTEHPDGITISNWFLRRIEDKETGGEVVCGKTGYVVQSGNCAVSYSVTDSGKQYIVVTANSTSSWRCIYDHVEIYNVYTD